MKFLRYITTCLIAIMATSYAASQVTYNLEFNNGTGVYTVSMNSATAYSGGLARISGSSQVSLVFPQVAGGFQITNLTNLQSSGTDLQWGFSRIDEPTENSSADYLFFTPSNAGAYTPFNIAANTDIDLFSFQSLSGCQGDVSIFDNTSDPLNTNPSINPDNNFVVLGGGFGNKFTASTSGPIPCSGTQISYCLDYDPTTKVYTVSMESNQSYTGPLARLSSSTQANIVTPHTTGGFQITDLTASTALGWGFSRLDAPAENTGADYLIFTPTNTGTYTPFNITANTPIDLFTFKSGSGCLGDLALFDNDADPLNANVTYNPDNSVTILGAGSGNKYSGNCNTGVSCCDAGGTAPVLSATTAANTCPTETADLSTISTTAPTGTTLSWHTATPATTVNKVTDATAVSTGTYYATFYDATNDCYSDNGDATTEVTVTITACCNSGTTAPTLSANTATNTCPTTTANLNTITATEPIGTTLSWHTATPATTANTVTDATAVAAGTFYAAFFDATNDCYSPTSPATVTISTCAITEVSYCLAYDPTTEIYTVSMESNQTYTGPLARLSSSTQANIVTPHTTGGFQITNLTASTALGWGFSRLDAPTENTSADYLIFTPTNTGTYTPFNITANTPIDLFTFKSGSGCLGDLSLFDNDADPLNANVTYNPDNSVTILGAGSGNKYSGNCNTGVSCCDAGDTAPVLSATTAANTCPTETADLSTITTTAPTGTTLSWHTATPATTVNKVTDATAVSTGTYYATFYDATNDCYSDNGDATTEVTVTITACCNSGTTAPTLSANTATNTCPTTTANLNTITATEPIGTTLSWHTATPATTANTVTDATAVAAGTFYAAFFDATNDCYSPTSPATVTISTCAITEVSYCLAYDPTTEIYTVSMESNQTYTGPLARLSSSTQANIVTPHTTGGFQITNLTASTALGWGFSRLDAPTENTSADYLIFTPTNTGTYTPFNITANTPIDLFTFKSGSGCLGDLALFDNDADPLNANVTYNPDNSVTILGAGSGNKYSGNCNTGVSCCDAGDTAPVLSATTAANTCPTETADLSTISTTAPTGTTLSWHTATPATTVNKVTDATAVSTGTYYATFYDATNDCYSDNGDATTEVTVTITSCCDAGTTAPTTSATTGTITCAVGYIDLDALHNGTLPANTTLEWSTDNDPSDGLSTTTKSPTTVAGTYYAYYFDSTNNCFSPASNAVTVTQEPNCSITAISNTCPDITVDLTSVASNNLPSGLELTWHTATPATDANKITDVTALTAGIYYATFYDPIGMCYSDNGDGTRPFEIIINTCAPTCNAGSSPPAIVLPNQ